MSNLKKNLTALSLILAFASLTVGCGTSIDNTSIDNSGTSESVSKSVDDSESTDESSSDEDTSDTDENNEDGTSETDDYIEVSDADFESIAGKWYIDGDTEKESLRIEEDGTFKNITPSGYINYKGYIKYEYDEEDGTKTYRYMLYTEDDEFLMSFIDDGDSEKTDLYVDSDNDDENDDEEAVHYVKMGTEDFNNKSNSNKITTAEQFVGTWGCGRATLDIEDLGNGNYSASIVWADSAAAYVEWDYMLEYDDDKMVCDCEGTKTYILYSDDSAEPERTVEYENGSASFEMTDDGIIWDDIEENSGEDMIFIQ